MVVATDFAESAIAKAYSAAPGATVTWIVDDATDSKLHGTFDVVLDRGCFGCIPVTCRARYVANVAKLLRVGGVWILKVHRAPATDLRAYAFERDEVLSVVASSHLAFEMASVTESALRFGRLGERLAWTFELRRT